VRTVERHGRPLARIDRVLVAAFVVCGIYTVPSLVFGQVNLLLALAVAVGFISLAADREIPAGSALGLAAFVKVFPAGFGLWFLRRRAWRAVGAAVATGSGLLAAGLVLGPEVTVAYVTEALLPRASRGAFVGGLGPNATFLTVRRPLSLVFPHSSVARTAGAVALLAPVVAVGCWRVDTTRRRLVATFTLVAGVLLALPSYPIYYVVLAYPLVPLLYLFEGPGRRLFTVGAALAMATVYLNDVRTGLTALGLPGPIHDAVLSVLTPVLTVGTVPFYGFALCLAGCLRYQVAGWQDDPSTTRDRRASDER
jgi:alpha-1,2-mannosyltransferase